MHGTVTKVGDFYPRSDLDQRQSLASRTLLATLEASQSPRILATLDTLALGQVIVALGQMVDMVILLPVCDEEEVQRSSRAVLQNRVKEFQHLCMQLD